MARVCVHLLQSKQISTYLQKTNNLCVLVGAREREHTLEVRSSDFIQVSQQVANIAFIQPHLEVPQFCCFLT